MNVPAIQSAQSAQSAQSDHQLKGSIPSCAGVQHHSFAFPISLEAPLLQRRESGAALTAPIGNAATQNEIEKIKLQKNLPRVSRRCYIASSSIQLSLRYHRESDTGNDQKRPDDTSSPEPDPELDEISASGRDQTMQYHHSTGQCCSSATYTPVEMNLSVSPRIATLKMGGIQARDGRGTGEGQAGDGRGTGGGAPPTAALQRRCSSSATKV